MKQEAILKLKNEVAENPDNPYVSYIATSLIGHIELSEELAEYILKEGKTIKGSLKAMEDVARANKTGNMAMFTPDQGLTIVFNYYMDIEMVKPKKVEKKAGAKKEDDAPTNESGVIESTEADTFSRNTWLQNDSTGVISAYKKGDAKPEDFASMVKVTKKDYDAYLAQGASAGNWVPGGGEVETEAEAEAEVEVEDADLGDLW